ncbi:MAG: hypothetical protein QF413_07660 [Dehalococcoidia bacterium]|jgi:hypothetical protein|nr:hypothetical protein [Dehalococcoidia bacterium]MDP7213549.1 hypothetical protein [Dehalococcoidia bacterium]MDP7515183.1 hypothetical protein [Dehalococcoidia bacterium]
MPTVTANGVSTYYETHGDGPPVLIMHGLLAGIRLAVRRPAAMQYRPSMVWGRL